MRSRPAAMRLAALVLVAAACGPSDDGGDLWWTVTERWRAEPADTLFDPTNIHRALEAAAWRLSDPAEAPRWAAERVEGSPRIVDGALVLVAARANPSLSREGLSLDASRLDLIELETSALKRTSVFLRWQGDPSPDSGAELRLEGRAIQSADGASSVVRFAVGRHPAWRGTITGLRIAFLTQPGTRLELRRLTASSLELTADGIEEALDRSWLVDLDGEVREAILEAPGVPLRRRFDIPTEARLRFAGGAPGAARQTFTFRVVVNDGGREELVGSVSAEPGTWQDGEVDLSRWAGRSVEILLEATTAGGLDTRLGLPAWGQPEIVVPGRGPRPPDVVLVSIDTLRADRMSLYGHSRPTTPHLEAWAASRAAIFEDAVATAPWTLPSHVSMFTGRDAHRHGVNHPRPAPGTLETLAEILRAAGWSTAAVTGGGYLDPTYGLAQGFQRWVYWQKTGSAPEELDEGIRRALSLARSLGDRPLFLFFHTYEVHAPYRPREPFFSRFAEDAGLGAPPPLPVYIRPEPGRTGKGRLPASGFRLREGPGRQDETAVPEGLEALPGVMYDAGVAYADERVARLVEELDEERPGRPLVVVTSDHGEMLGEHDLAGHATLYEGNLRVPLLVALPDGSSAGRRLREPVSLVDLVPTLLDSLGLPPAAEADGRSLLAELRGAEPRSGRETWSYAATGGHGLALRRDGRLKAILRNGAWPPHRGKLEFYRLDRDPTELDDLADEVPEALLRRVRDETDRIPGLRLVLKAGARYLAGTLSGAAVTWANVKTTSAPAPRMHWIGPGRTGFRVGAGKEATLTLEEATGPGLEIEIEDAPRLELPFGSALSGQPELRRLDAGTWAEGPCEPAARACVRLFWSGPPPAIDEGDPEDLPEGLVEQLEALGYLG